MTAGTATAPVVRAMLDQARRKDYHCGVLGVRAQPRWEGPVTFTHHDVPVHVVPCVSTLAVREALLDHDTDTWLVVLTDRDDEDLGAGVLTHLVWHRLRTPDPWEAVSMRFAAAGIDSRLVDRTGHRDLAIGLLAAAPPDGWPPAPGGVLTRDHALGSAARHHLQLGEPGSETDAVAVLGWSTSVDAPARIADLRGLAGDALADAVIEWLAAQAGTAAGPLLQLLRAGQLSDVVPLGIVADLLADDRGGRDADRERTAREALIRLEPRLGGRAPSRAELAAWGREAAAVVRELLLDPDTRAVGERVITRADAVLTELRADSLAEASELLRAGLTERLNRLAAAITAALAPHRADRQGLHTAVEDVWSGVVTHRLVEVDHRVAPFRAAVRLLRWLALPDSGTEPSLGGLLDRHRDVDAWVDSAVNDAAVGVGDRELGTALGRVLAATRERRDGHDLEFAAALATHTSSSGTGVLALEDVLPRTVLPLVRHAPVLLLVLDGMSAGVGAEVVDSVLEHGAHGWLEALLPGHTRRAAALAVLPTITEFSRTSLLCGELRAGQQPHERAGFDSLLRAHGLAGKLFHKKPLEHSRLGLAVADDVGAAIDDVSGTPLVACVLNTIDDALDRSDPAGTAWSVDTVKHLAPLLERAVRAGRTTVLTADHGHVVERRETAQRTFGDISSARSRAADQPAGAGEVLVEGDRVLAHGGRAVLAVDERLRYGPLKAGYHGGASPAEAVVPLCVLVPGAVPEGAGLTLAGPQEPAWWSGPLPTSARAAAPATAPTLFDEAASAAPVNSPGADLARAVVASPTFATQRRLAGRGLSPQQVEALLAALLDAQGHRLAPAAAASAAGIPTQRLRGAIAAAQRLLNVEGYPVLRLDADGQGPVLDEALLREQFEVRR